MNTLTNLIIIEKDNDSIFVFPSEAAAVSRRKEFLNVTGKKAVKNSRFVSWDRFKENITLHNKLEKPVNSTLRRLFAADIIRRNQVEQLFSRLIPLEYREQAGGFTDSIYRVLPELDRLIRTLKDAPSTMASGLSSDYQKLYHEYTEFMSSNGLFEPSWDLPVLHNVGGNIFIIHPEIIEDFNEWDKRLKNVGCKTLSFTDFISPGFRLFENTVIETDTVLNEISKLLNNGVHYSAIAVTAADERTAELLMSKAELRGITFNYRSGKPLSKYPAGRLPELLRTCRTSGYSISSMKNLLLYRAFVWKDADTAAALIRFGIEHRCLKNTSMGPSGDVWARRLKSIKRQDYVKRDEMLAFYKKLKKNIEKVTNCKSFGALSHAFQVFVSSFLETETELWDSECEQVFQRTREVLSSLRQTEAKLENLVVSDPLGLWIDLLNEKIYVQQQSVQGIPLFPYRVSAIINPAHHFVIGLSHDASTVVSAAFSFLTDQQRKDIGAGELNMSDDFIRIYAASGSNVRFSCATETAGGTALPPGFFIENASISRFNSAHMDVEFFNDPVQAENRWWERACTAGFKINEAGILPNLTQIQLSGFSYASASFMADKGFDASAQLFPEEIVSNQLIPALSDVDGGFFRVSATSLNRWSDCRFNLLLSEALGIYDEEYVLRAEDPWTAGSVLHDILFEFFTSIRDSGSSFRLSGNTGAYKKLLSESAVKVFKDWEAGGNYFFGPAWESMKRKTLQDLLFFPEAEAEYFEGLKPELLEEWLEFNIESQQIRVFGKLDRISTGEDGSVIVDYKKSWKKQSRAKFISEDEQGRLLPPEIGYQLPLYILLARENALEISAASYYSITGASHFPVSGTYGVLDNDDIDRLCEYTLAEVERMAEESRRGDFTTPERCDGCKFRAICRKRFNVRWANR